MTRRLTTPVLLFRLFVLIFFFDASACVAAATEVQLQSIIDDVPIRKIPGIVLLVEGPDINFRGARGYADRKTKKPIKIVHSLRAGSICKTYVAALTIMAANEGLIDLDLPIERYLSEGVLGKLPDGLRPSVRQLLNHTSGIPDYYGVRFYLKDWKHRGPLTTELVLHAIRGKKATNAPGEQFSYSNTNYHLIALILEAVYQKPLKALFYDQIFEPLELRSTFYNQQFPPGDEIHGYGSPGRPWNDTYDWQENTGPDGGIIVRTSDLATWIRELFSKDGQFFDIGSEMAAAPIIENERKMQGMGVEILQSRSGVKVLGHTGGADGYLTAAYYIEATDTVMVLHMNKFDAKTFGSVISQVLKVISV